MFDVTHIVQSGGLLLLGVFLFAEVGLFLGFFLPGDTLLIAAGIFAKQGKLSLAGVMVVGALAAIAGDNFSYFLGQKFGRGLFKKQGSVIFEPKHLETAEKFYTRFGVKAVAVAHYLPVVRTFTPLFAGIGRMHYQKFLIFDAIGDVSWAIALTLIGYYLGSRIPNIDHYILLVVAFVVVASATPTIIQYVRLKRRQQRKTK